MQIPWLSFTTISHLKQSISSNVKFEERPWGIVKSFVNDNFYIQNIILYNTKLQFLKRKEFFI